MNKFKFIRELLETEKFNINQKERFLKLVSSELMKSEMNDNQVLDDIKQIKERIGLKFEHKKQEAKEKDSTKTLPIFNPLQEMDVKEGRKVLEDSLITFAPRTKIDVDEAKQLLSDSIIELPDASVQSLSTEEARKILNEGANFSSHAIDVDLISKNNEVGKNKSQTEIQSANINDNNSDDLPKYYYPVSLFKFLFNYNQNSILKSTCHDIDSDELEIINQYCNTEVYDFNCHLKKIIEAYGIHEKKYFAPTGLKTLFRVYLTGKNYNDVRLNGWTSDVIKINWSCEELQKWSAENQGVPPNPSDGIIEQFENTGYEFTRISSKVTGQHIQSFSQLVIHFKHLFHIRSDNSLRSIIERKNKVEKWNDKIDFIIGDDVFPINIEHFTDIDKLIQAYKKIVLLSLEIKEKHNLEKPIIKLSASVDLEEFKFSIHHLNTEYKKSISNTKERLGQSYRNLITNQINGLCELHLRADFGQNQCAQINLWNGNPRTDISIVEENFKGVEHLFVFPKK